MKDSVEREAFKEYLHSWLDLRAFWRRRASLLADPILALPPANAKLGQGPVSFAFQATFGPLTICLAAASLLGIFVPMPSGPYSQASMPPLETIWDEAATLAARRVELERTLDNARASATTSTPLPVEPLETELRLVLNSESIR